MLCIEIKADTNDGDYVSERHQIEQVDIPLFRKIGALIAGKSHNWDSSEYRRAGDGPREKYAKHLTEEEFDIFNDYIPHGEYGIHTIVEMKILEVEEKEDLLVKPKKKKKVE